MLRGHHSQRPEGFVEGNRSSLPVLAILGDVAIAARCPKSNDSNILYPVGVCTVDIPPNETD